MVQLDLFINLFVVSFGRSQSEILFSSQHRTRELLAVICNAESALRIWMTKCYTALFCRVSIISATSVGACISPNPSKKVLSPSSALSMSVGRLSTPSLWWLWLSFTTMHSMKPIWLNSHYSHRRKQAGAQKKSKSFKPLLLGYMHIGITPLLLKGDNSFLTVGAFLSSETPCYH